MELPNGPPAAALHIFCQAAFDILVLCSLPEHGYCQMASCILQGTWIGCPSAEQYLAAMIVLMAAMQSPLVQGLFDPACRTVGLTIQSSACRVDEGPDEGPVAMTLDGI